MIHDTAGNLDSGQIATSWCKEKLFMPNLTKTWQKLQREIPRERSQKKRERIYFHGKQKWILILWCLRGSLDN